MVSDFLTTKNTKNTKNTKDMTQKEVNNLAYKIVGCAIEVHKRLGPGLLESIYEKCLVEELKFNGFQVQQQIKNSYRI